MGPVPLSLRPRALSLKRLAVNFQYLSARNRFSQSTLLYQVAAVNRFFSQLLAPAHCSGPLLSKRAPPREMDFRPGSAIGPNGVVFTNPQDSGLGNFSIVGLPEIGLFIPSRSLLA